MESYLLNLIPSEYRNSSTNKFIFSIKKKFLLKKFKHDTKNLCASFIEIFTPEIIENDINFIKTAIDSSKLYISDESRLRSALSHMAYVKHYELYIIISWFYQNAREFIPDEYFPKICKVMSDLNLLEELYLKIFISAKFFYVEIEISQDKDVIEKALKNYKYLLS